MLIVLGRSTFRKPIDDQTRARLAELASAVRTRHPGNIDYRFSVDTEDPHVLRLTERWDRLESFIAHGKTPEVAAIVEIVNPRDTESTEVRRYEASAEVTL
jgi:quinol monooxygenase YgiN